MRQISRGHHLRFVPLNPASGFNTNGRFFRADHLEDLDAEYLKHNSSPDGKVHYKMENCVWLEPLEDKNLMFHCRLEGGRLTAEKKIDLVSKWMENGEGSS
ncbi:hypothetical protein CEXT_416391 [Caerostris extrusa]|uniref:Uncharacterized protein n=1 Tax=Caerostris extrusa TaxID=172846 RepID=A0AAV4Y765_CAEEX|nr:hypothetical protein CEXT_416391 [Caerostris extrusa]